MAVLVFATALVFFAGGATADPATWWPARPRGVVLLFVYLPAFATPFLTRRALSQKLGIYRVLRAMAAPSPTA